MQHRLLKGRWTLCLRAADAALAFGTAGRPGQCSAASPLQVWAAGGTAAERTNASRRAPAGPWRPSDVAETPTVAAQL